MASFPGENNMTHLVEVLEEVDNATLSLVLGEAGRGRVETSTLEGSELGNGSNGGAADVEGSRGLDDTRGGGPEGADNGGAEHCGSVELSAKAKEM